MLEERALPHSIILFGEAGIGKTTLARLISASVLCKNRENIEPCGECSSCQRIFNDNSIEVIEVDGALNSSVESIKQVLEAAQYKPQMSAFRFFIIDEAQRLSIQAFCSMLKTLEESPRYNYFLFTTTNLNKIPESITSRSIRLALKLPGKGEIRTYISNHYSHFNDKWCETLVYATDQKPRNLFNIINLSKYLKTPRDLLLILGLPSENTLKLYWYAIQFKNVRMALSLKRSLNESTVDRWHLVSLLLKNLSNIVTDWKVGLYQRVVMILMNFSRINNLDSKLLLDIITYSLIDNQKKNFYKVLKKVKDHTKLFYEIVRNRDDVVIKNYKNVFIRGKKSLTDKVNKILNG